MGHRGPTSEEAVWRSFAPLSFTMSIVESSEEVVFAIGIPASVDCSFLKRKNPAWGIVASANV
jgi:hypothetical protein